MVVQICDESAVKRCSGVWDIEFLENNFNKLLITKRPTEDLSCLSKVK